jgi:hypothetical protein
VITFGSDKRSGLVDTGHMGLEENTNAPKKRYPGTDWLVEWPYAVSSAIVLAMFVSAVNEWGNQ